MCVPILVAFAADPKKTDTSKGLARISTSIQGQVETFTGLMITISYIAGIGFTILGKGLCLQNWLRLVIPLISPPAKGRPTISEL